MVKFLLRPDNIEFIAFLGLLSVGGVYSLRVLAKDNTGKSIMGVIGS